MMKTIMLKLNGESRSLDVEPSDLLLEVLRDKLGVKSPKAGCERGDCGACTILLDGKPVRSCLILAVEVEGQEITTLEGIGRNGPTPLQESFIRHNAFQCGYCAPGFLMAALGYLKTNPAPTRQELAHGISGNLCRCQDYDKILTGLLRGAEIMRKG